MYQVLRTIYPLGRWDHFPFLAHKKEFQTSALRSKEDWASLKDSMLISHRVLFQNMPKTYERRKVATAIFNYTQNKPESQTKHQTVSGDSDLEVTKLVVQSHVSTFRLKVEGNGELEFQVKTNFRFRNQDFKAEKKNFVQCPEFRRNKKNKKGLLSRTYGGFAESKSRLKTIVKLKQPCKQKFSSNRLRIHERRGRSRSQRKVLDLKACAGERI